MVRAAARNAPARFPVLARPYIYVSPEPSPPAPLPRAWTLALAAFAFAVRAAVALELGRTALFRKPQLDSFEFLLWGQGIAHGNLFQWLAPTHGPGYPFFLGTLLALTGGSVIAVRLLQAPALPIAL